ncbi:MAG: hypothetical protein EHM81_14450, partial [Chloroflexi bacterium]
NFDFRDTYSPANPKSWSLTPNLPRNDNQPVAISISDASLIPGIYYLKIDSPNVSYRNNTQRAVVTSNVNVTLKNSATEAIVWAVDLRTNTPVANAPLRLLDQTLQQISGGMTDSNGLWRGELSKTDVYRNVVYAVLGQPGDELFGMAVSNWNQGITPWDFELRANFSGPRPTIYIYTERPVYRPGDTLHFRGIIRDIYDGRYSDAGFKTVTVGMSDPNSKVVEQTVEVSDYGTFDGDFALPANAIPGDYNLVSRPDGKDEANNSWLYFQVADYRKPEINLSVSLSPDPASSGEKLTGKVNAEYFFGAPVADLPFQWRLYSRSSYFSIPSFQAGIYNTKWLSGATGRFGLPYLTGEGRTGADGMFSIPFDEIKTESTLELTLEVTATESGGFPFSARESVTLHPARFYAGIRPDAWFGQAGTALGYSLLTVDWDQEPVSKTLAVNFQKVRWERSGGLYGNYEFTPIYTPVESKTITTASDGTARVSFMPAEAGTYMLDVSGEGAHSQDMLWVGGAEQAS